MKGYKGPATLGRTIHPIPDNFFIDGNGLDNVF
jgi:hypothetical protein